MSVFENTYNGEELCANMIQNTLALCKLNGIPPEEVAREIGVADKYFYRKHNDISANKLQKLCARFDVTAEKLWSRGFSMELRKKALEIEMERIRAELEEYKKPGTAVPKKKKKSEDTPPEIMTPPLEENEDESEE